MNPQEPGTTAGTERERPDKPLGRGLEDISHLFLSHRPIEGTAQARDSAPESHSGSHARTLLLKPCGPVSRNALALMLREMDSSVEEGLRVIDSCVPCHPYGEIDLLALDKSNQLAIIDFDVTPNESLLLRGIGHFDWAMHNLFTLRRMYSGETINMLAQPRLLLLAPSFSSQLTSVARYVASPQIEWIRFHMVEAGGAIGVLFEHLRQAG